MNIEVNIAPKIEGDFTVHVVVLEKETFDNVGSNGETSFRNVMMKVLPDANGTPLTLVPDKSITLNLFVDLTNTFIEEICDLEVIVFIQGTDYQKK